MLINKDLNHVKFISYTGEYPCLCSGTLTVEINGEEVEFDDITSGGDVWFDSNCSEHVEEGSWKVHVPEEYSSYSDAINEVMNENVPWGCCGGCV